MLLRRKGYKDATGINTDTGRSSSQGGGRGNLLLAWNRHLDGSEDFPAELQEDWFLTTSKKRGELNDNTMLHFRSCTLGDNAERWRCMPRDAA